MKKASEHRSEGEGWFTTHTLCCLCWHDVPTGMLREFCKFTIIHTVELSEWLYSSSKLILRVLELRTMETPEVVFLYHDYDLHNPV